jgi:transcriptional regulator with XRE-family HTH domain
MDIKQISYNIKKFRELKNLTREFVATELEMSVSGYSKIERGEIDLSISKLQKISEVLKVPTNEILNFDVTNIFNIANNQQVEGFGNKESSITNNTNIVDDYIRKYIQKLEEEIERLKTTHV